MKVNKKFIYGISIFIGILIIGLMGVFWYTYSSIFIFTFERSNAIVYDQIEVINEEIELTINNETINNIFATNINHYKEDFYINLKERYIKINVDYKGVTIPLKATFTINLHNDNIEFIYNNLKWGKWRLPIPLFQELFTRHISNVGGNKIYLDNLTEIDVLELRRIKLYEEDVKLSIGINEKKLEDFLRILFDNYNKEILAFYSQYENENYQLIYGLFSEKQIDDAIINVLIMDYMEDKEFLKDLLVLLDDEVINDLFIENPYLLSIDAEEISAKKALLQAKQEMNSFQLLLESIIKYDANKANKLFVLGNNPYDFERDMVITPLLLVESYKLPVTEEFASKAEYFYDEEGFYIIYFLNANQYVIYKEGVYEIISIEEFEEVYNQYTFGKKQLPNKKHMGRKEIETVVMDYYGTDRVFTRYLAIDNQYAFILASYGVNYQNIVPIALEKDNNTWHIIQANITDFYEFNELNRGYNISLIPGHIKDKDRIIPLSFNDRTKIVEDLYEREIISNKSFSQLLYASYMNKFIFIKLLDGREFVYTVSFGFLDKIYTLEEALGSYRVPKIIMIQE